jgi:hypothetical protein
VLATVADAPDGAEAGPPIGPQTLEQYLRSRTAELVLHAPDLGTDIEPPAAPLAERGAFLAERAARQGRGLEVVLALSDRRPLSPHFSVF